MDRTKFRLMVTVLARALRNQPESIQLYEISNKLRSAGSADGAETGRNDVTSPETDLEEDDDLDSLVKEKSDIIVQILSGADAASPMRRNIQSLYNQIRSLQNAIRRVGTDMYAELGSEETKDLDQSSVGALRDAFAREARQLDGILNTFSVLRSLESKIKNETQAGPVQHQLPARTKREIATEQIRPAKPKKR